MTELLTVENVSAGYGEKEVIHNVSFRLEKHTLTGMLGPNGCGKTTLMRCVIQQLRHSGNCLLDGEAVERMKPRRLAGCISYIAQRSGISVSLPVLDVVLMGYNPVLKLLEYPSAVQISRAMDTLDAVGLVHCAGKDFQTLSEGQKQLVLLARTMIEDTKLLVLDEPDSALDFQNRYQMLKLLKQMVWDNEKAGLLCLHDPGLALEFCEQILLMKDGRVVHVLHPQRDSAEEMEIAMRDLYGDVMLAECRDRKGRRHWTLVWEG